MPQRDGRIAFDTAPQATVGSAQPTAPNGGDDLLAPSPPPPGGAAAPSGPAAPAQASGRQPADLVAPATPDPQRDRDGRTTLSQWMAIGDAFQPLPGGPLLTRSQTPQPAAVALASPGSTVHAVLAGRVHRSGTGLELRSMDGRVIGYRGDAVVNWTAGDGESVRAGTVLGWVSDQTHSGHLSTMAFYVQRPDGVAVDPVGWLAGLADPRELGLSGEIAGGTDPFSTDLRLAGLFDGGPA